MKRKILITLLNFIFIVFLIFILEFISYNLIFENLQDYLSSFFDKSIDCKLSLKLPDYKPIDVALPYETRNDDTIPYDAKKRPVLFLGCSYTYGQGIEKDKIFGSQFQKLTDIKTNTVAHMGASADNVLSWVYYMYNNGEFEKNNYKYVVYTWMYHHIFRKESIMLDKYLVDKHNAEKELSIKNRIMHILDKSFFVRYINMRLLINNDKNLFLYQSENILKIYNLIKEKIPDVKFIFLIYDDITENGHEGIESKYLDTKIWSFLEEHGIVVISTKDLVGDILYKPEYKLVYDPFQEPHHPNSDAWSIVTPKFIKKLNIN